MTMGISLQWFVFIPSILLISKLKLSPSNSSIKTKDIIFILSALLILYVNAIGVHGFDISPLELNTYFDNSYYAKVSDALLKTGVENPNVIHHNFIPETASIYHFTDLWSNGFISKAFNINSIHAFLFISNVTPWFLAYIFVFYRIQNFLSLSTWQVFTISLLSIYGLRLIFEINYAPYEYFSKWYKGGLFSIYKVNKTVHLIPIACILFEQISLKRYYQTVLIVILAIGCYITLLPSLLFASSVLLLIAFVSKKSDSSQSLLHRVLYFKKELITLGVFVTSFFIYKLIFTDNTIGRAFTNVETSLTSKVIIIIEHLYSSYIYMPLLVLILFYELWEFKKTKELPILSLFFLSGVIGAILFINISSNYGNVIQSLRNFVKPISFGLGFFMIPVLLRTRLKIPLLLILLSGVYYNFHFGFQQKKESVTNLEKTMFEHYNESTNKNWAISTSKQGYWNYTFKIPGKKLLNLKDSNFPIDLSGCLYKDKNLQEWCINNVKNPCCQNDTVSIELLFDKYQIKYLITDHKLTSKIDGLNLISRDSTHNISFYSFNLNSSQ